MSLDLSGFYLFSSIFSDYTIASLKGDTDADYNVSGLVSFLARISSSTDMLGVNSLLLGFLSIYSDFKFLMFFTGTTLQFLDIAFSVSGPAPPKSVESKEY